MHYTQQSPSQSRDIRLTHLLASRYWADPSVRKGGPAQEFFDVAGPGNFNDPDELYVGDGSLTHEEEQAVMALWCIMTGPLLVGIGTTPSTIAAIMASAERVGAQTSGTCRRPRRRSS